MPKEKSRYFSFILYPDSTPSDWVQKLELIGVPMAISPIHDKDLSNVEGVMYKKAHYHIIYIAANPVTADSVRKKIQRSLGQKSLAKVQIIATTVEHVYQYLTHESKDAIAKKKHKYDAKDIVLLNNFDLDRYIVVDSEDKKDLLNLLLKIIVQERLANVIDLAEWVAKNGKAYGLPDMDQINSLVIKESTGIMRLYFDGVYQKKKSEEEVLNSLNIVKSKKIRKEKKS